MIGDFLLLLVIAITWTVWWIVTPFEACEKIVRCSEGGFMRGTMLTLRGS